MNGFNARLVTAMVTPFQSDGRVDYPALERLANYLVDTGSEGLLVNGTTGESPTLTNDEKLEIVRVVKRAVSGSNVPIMAGAGTNNTASTVEHARKVAALGVDALLIVVPYYNKPSQRGMIAHFSEVARAVEAPIIIYNIPGRCVVNMTAETMAVLAEQHANIIGVKQSNADLDQVGEITRKTPGRFKLWSGDDSLTLPMMSLGAQGVISVASHLAGRQILQMIETIEAGELVDALALQHELLDLFKELFFLPNPTVVKSCLARLGLMGGTMRLPMVEPDATEWQRIDKLLQRYKNTLALEAVV